MDSDAIASSSSRISDSNDSSDSTLEGKGYGYSITAGCRERVAQSMKLVKIIDNWIKGGMPSIPHLVEKFPPIFKSRCECRNRNDMCKSIADVKKSCRQLFKTKNIVETAEKQLKNAKAEKANALEQLQSARNDQNDQSNPNDLV